MEKGLPLTLQTIDEVPNYYKKAELKMPGANAEIIVDYYNRRIKVTGYTGFFEEIAGTLKTISTVEEMAKIIVYAPPEKKNELEACGYSKEGTISGYYSGKNCYVFTSYPEYLRRISFHKEKEDLVIESCLKKDRKTGIVSQKTKKSRKKREREKGKILLPEEYIARPAVQTDASVMANLYRQEFKFYPTPLHIESYLLRNMDSNVLYFLIEKKGMIVSLASAEMDPQNRTAEITDCLTISSERGNGLIKELITILEKELSDRSFKSAYTLCRASSFGINMAFSSLGYAYTGRLVNNCKIGEGFENMNIWCKILK